MVITDPARAFGRSREDFGDLSTAEGILLDCCRNGAPAVVGDDLPEKESDDNRLRASFVRFLALGGDPETAVHERGIWLTGGWLIGDLDFSAAAVPHRFVLHCCRVEQIDLRQARTKFLGLHACRITGPLNADGLYCAGGLFIRSGSHASNGVRLLGSTIEGNLDCSGSKFDAGEDGEALSLDGATITGDVFLNENVLASGAVRLLGARIGGDLDCSGSNFQNEGKEALSCDRAEISGSVFMKAPFHAVGEVRMLGATVGGNFECSGGRFENGTGNALAADASSFARNLLFDDGFHASGTVRLPGARIVGDLYCTKGRFENPAHFALRLAGCRIEGLLMFESVALLSGAVDLTSAFTANLVDDLESWRGTSGQLILDGFTYNRIAGLAPTDAKTRVAWLRHQRPDHLNEQFRPQPFEQLILVLRATGHPNEARRVAIEKQIGLRKARKVVFGTGWLHWLYGFTAGYGYRPVRLLVAIPIVWIMCALIYSASVDPLWLQGGPALLAPRGDEPSSACLLARAAARSGDPCPKPAPDFRTFAPLAYSADVLLPIVDFGYQQEWRPVVAERDGTPLPWGQALRWIYWFEIAFGWVAGLLLAGIAGSLLKKD